MVGSLAAQTPQRGGGWLSLCNPLWTEAHCQGRALSTYKLVLN